MSEQAYLSMTVPSVDYEQTRAQVASSDGGLWDVAVVKTSTSVDVRAVYTRGTRHEAAQHCVREWRDDTARRVVVEITDELSNRQSLILTLHPGVEHYGRVPEPPEPSTPVLRYPTRAELAETERDAAELLEELDW